jgi:hypothetical protein
MKSYKKKINILLLSFGLIILWSLAGLTVGKLVAKLLSPKIELASTDNDLNERLQLNSLLQIFGPSKFKYISENEIRIIGLLAGSNNGAILVSIANGPVKTLKVGEVSDDGWIFSGVTTETANFIFQGQIMKIPFSLKKNNTLSNKPTNTKKIDLINSLI